MTAYDRHQGYTHQVVRTVYDASGELIVSSRFGLRSKAAAARKVSHTKQFDGEDVKMGRTIEYRIESL